MAFSFFPRPMRVPGSTWRSRCNDSSNGERYKGIIPMMWRSSSSGLLMPSQVGIVIPRLLSGAGSGMHAGIEPMHDGIVWEALGLLRLASFLHGFGPVAITERLLEPTGHCQ